jgi:hypothetical protein
MDTIARSSLQRDSNDHSQQVCKYQMGKHRVLKLGIGVGKSLVTKGRYNKTNTRGISFKLV